jgi:phage terminase small subunit
MAFNSQKKAYVDGLRAGMRKKEAAIAAGYAASCASQTAARLSKDPGVLAYMARLDTPQSVQVTAESVAPDTPPPVPAIAPALPKTASIDPLEYMESVISDPMQDPKLRLDAAKALAPYRHPRLEVANKKDEKDKKAKDVQANRFGVALAPGQLKAVK